MVELGLKEGKAVHTEYGKYSILREKRPLWRKEEERKAMFMLEPDVHVLLSAAEHI